MLLFRSSPAGWRPGGARSATQHPSTATQPCCGVWLVFLWIKGAGTGTGTASAAWLRNRLRGTVRPFQQLPVPTGPAPPRNRAVVVWFVLLWIKGAGAGCTASAAWLREDIPSIC
jgi:hypothetical protein